ncbi:DUF2868 domain-containing protein [Melaminivora sp.]|uniref:DUF2868 domain-containing protein n=1 Tax=Melaminivora sp. TaxID=1933032 RepID=UPI0028B16DB8|nr:DUF2868 domain-containing protein [Melaminivora sp.]
MKNYAASPSTASQVLALEEAQLRRILLAQAVARQDAQGSLVTAAESEAALQDGVAGARAAGAVPVQPGDVLLPRAEALLRHAAGREPAIAALQADGWRLRWLARTLPLAALALGLAADRIANAHRVDLLSPPLLLVLAWNLAVYLALAWRALRRSPAPSGAPPAAQEPPLALRWLAWLERAPGSRQGLAARVAADFQAHWLTHTAPLQGARLARVLHLCAAAWGAGLALSLLLRGLVVRYQFGWESTFLDAAQVHTLAHALFWPLTALTGAAPFSLAEIVASENFAGQGSAGGRWVWMYVGLLALMVVLPRLALAAWERWREARLARHLALDLAAPEFDALRAALPADLVLGVAGANATERHALAQVLGLHPAPAAADRLHWVAADQAAAQQAVDAVVLAWSPVPEERLPAAWRQAPVLTLPWSGWGASWVREPALFDRLRPLLPQHAAALARLDEAWQAQSRQRFEQSVQLLTGHLRACAALAGEEQRAEPLAQQLQALDAALRSLHGLTPPAGAQAGEPGAGPHSASPPRPDGATTDRAGTDVLAVVGTSAGAAAGAAAGAKAGALIDLGLGGLSLGAGTAVGALLGGVTAWTLRGLQKRGSAQEALRQMTQAACLHYLLLAHQGRLADDTLQALSASWPAQLDEALGPHWPALHAALLVREGAPAGSSATGLLGAVLQAVLQRSPAGPAPQSPSTTYLDTTGGASPT